MKKLILSFLIVLSIHNYYLKDDIQKIPMVIFLSINEKSNVKTNEDLLEDVIYNQVSKYYSETSKGKIILYNPFKHGVMRINVSAKYNYENRREIGIESIIKSDKLIDYLSFDQNNNRIIEKDELIIINIIEIDDTYDKPIASNIKTKDFFINKDIKIDSFIQLSSKEVFSNRESLLTPSTVAHEIGHHLGLPDLYDTDYSSSGLGPLSLMSEIHNDQPINLDPWSKIYLGIDKATLINDKGLHKIDEGKIYMVKTNKNWIYYLIENRKFEGYDASLSDVMNSDGIFIYKINEKIINNTIDLNHVNRDENNMGVQYLGKEVFDIQEEIHLKTIDVDHLLIKNNKK